MPRTRMTDNSVLQLTLGVHLALLMLLAMVNRLLFGNEFVVEHQVVIGNLRLAVCGGFFLAQVCLVGTWAAFSNAATALRYGVLLLFLPLLVAVHAQVFAQAFVILWWALHSQEPHRTLFWGINLCSYVWTFTLGAFLIRSLGIEVVARDALIEQPPHRFQFRLSSLFAWLLLASLVLGAGRLLSFMRSTDFEFDLANVFRSEWHYSDQYAWKYLILSLALCYCVLAVRSWKLVGSVLVFAPLVLSILDALWLKPWLYGAGQDGNAMNTGMPRDFVGLLYYVFVATFAGTLLAVRGCGFEMRLQTPWWLALFRRNTV